MPAENVKLLVLDVDGVLTDGQIIWQGDGFDAKNFDVKDGLGITLLRKARIEVAFVSGRSSKAVSSRAEELGVRHVHQGVADKLAAAREVMHKCGVREEETGYMGDDLPDLPVLRRVGFAAAPADAAAEVRSVVELVTRAPGGRGAVREVAERILKAQQRWGNAVESFLT